MDFNEKDRIEIRRPDGTTQYGTVRRKAMGTIIYTQDDCGLRGECHESQAIVLPNIVAEFESVVLAVEYARRKKSAVGLGSEHAVIEANCKWLCARLEELRGKLEAAVKPAESAQVEPTVGIDAGDVVEFDAMTIGLKSMMVVRGIVRVVRNDLYEVRTDQGETYVLRFADLRLV